MNILMKLINSTLVQSIVALVAGIILYNFIKKIINKNLNVKKLNSKQETYVKLINNIMVN